MMSDADISGYRYSNAHRSHAHQYLLPAVDSILNRLTQEGLEQRCFDLGCGNGSVANHLTENGWDVIGVDPSVEGIKHAKQDFPDLKLFDGSAYDDLSAHYGQFPVLISLEVVEHVYAPRDYAKTAFDLLSGGGSYNFHPLSWLLEESGVGCYRQDGCALHRLVGSRPHQVLVDEDFG